MRGCCICVTGEIKDVAHQWRHHREIGDDYEIRPVYGTLYMVRTVCGAARNDAAMSLLSANFPIYGDVLLIRIIEGFIFDTTFDEIASDLITGISVGGSEVGSQNIHSLDFDLNMTNPAMAGSDVSSDEFDEFDEFDEYDECGESRYDSD
jgi:hypothetical protein